MRKNVAIICLLVVICLLSTGCQSATYKQAVSDYEAATVSVEAQNAKLGAAISDAEALIAKGETALDASLIPALETAISETKAAKYTVPEMPKDEEAIVAEVATLNSVDYSGVLENLSAAKESLETSIKQYALVNAPSEAYVISCLGKVTNVVDISAVTEDNDPNGNLNKAGGYTAQVYFSSDLIDQNSVYGTTVIDKGTDCGGSVEVFLTPEDANNRNEYLAAFDGSILSSGSHTVIGTVVVRTSNELMASQQKEMEANIIAALTAIEG